jgi:D-sedoheptulose 7-phosphate isomerase
MNTKITQMIQDSLKVQETLLDQDELIAQIAARLIEALRAGHKIFVCGNGGSAADAEHLAAELVGRFLVERKAYPAMALTTNTSLLTALGNDYGYDSVFVRQVEAFVEPGDVVIGITTSGNSPNVLRALERARDRGAVTIGLTGESGGKLKALADLCLCVASRHTPRIQEAHTLVIHSVCALVETALAEALS